MKRSVRHYAPLLKPRYPDWVCYCSRGGYRYWRRRPATPVPRPAMSDNSGHIRRVAALMNDPAARANACRVLGTAAKEQTEYLTKHQAEDVRLVFHFVDLVSRGERP
jgi:hypothetical protein